MVHHCCYGPLLTPYLHHHCCYGPLLTPYLHHHCCCAPSDTMWVITTVAMDHYWHHIYIITVAVLHLIPCESSPLLLRSMLTSCPSSALLLWTTANTMSVVTVRAPVSGVWRTEGLLQRRRRGAVFKQNPARLLQSWSPGHRTVQQPRGVHSSRTEQFAVVGLQSCQMPPDSFSVSRSVNVFMLC